MNAQVEEIISELNYALALPFVTIEQKSIVRDEIKRIHKKAFASLKQPAPPCQECEDCKHDLEGYMEANKALINREWVGLSDDEVNDIAFHEGISPFRIQDIYIAFEQELKTKNGFSGLKEKNT